MVCLLRVQFAHLLVRGGALSFLPSFHPPGPGIEHRCLISGGIHRWCAQRARYYQLVIRSASFNTLGVCECARPPWLQGLTARSLNLTGDVRHYAIVRDDWASVVARHYRAHLRFPICMYAHTHTHTHTHRHIYIYTYIQLCIPCIHIYIYICGCRMCSLTIKRVPFAHALAATTLW